MLGIKNCVLINIGFTKNINSRLFSILPSKWETSELFILPSIFSSPDPRSASYLFAILAYNTDISKPNQ